MIRSTVALRKATLFLSMLLLATSPTVLLLKAQSTTPKGPTGQRRLLPFLSRKIQQCRKCTVMISCNEI
jgi:hypothetical protein